MSAPLRARLVAFYQRHNPENVHKVDTILGAWGHNEAELWRQMAAKYGQRAVDEAQRAPPPPSTGFSAAPVLQPLPFSPAGFASQVPPPAPPRRPNPSRFAAPPVPGRGFSPAPPAPGFGAPLPGYSVPPHISAVCRPVPAARAAPHWDLLAEVCAVAALPREASARGENVDAIERASEGRHSTPTHEATCALPVLEKLSEGGKAFALAQGGFLKALRGGAPLVVAVGGASGSADTTFVLIDRRLLLCLRAALRLVEQPPVIARDVARALEAIQRAGPWRAASSGFAQRFAGGTLDALRRDLKDARRQAKTDAGSAVAQLRRLTDPDYAAALGMPRASDPWAAPEVATDLFDCLGGVLAGSASLVGDQEGQRRLRPEACARGVASFDILSRSLVRRRGAALAMLLDVLRFAAGLDALSPRQQASRPRGSSFRGRGSRPAPPGAGRRSLRPRASGGRGPRTRPPSVAPAQVRIREWTGSVGAAVERTAELSGSQRRGVPARPPAGAPGRATSVVVADPPKPPAVVAAPPAEPPKRAAPAVVAAPEEKRRRVAGRLVAFDDEGHAPKAWRRDLSPRKPCTEKAGRSKRVSFGDGAAPTPATEPVVDPARRAQLRRLLGRRMDRAIWDAFRSREFAPIEALLGHGADAAYVRTEGGGETALMAAAYHGREEICRALLSRGADPRKTDKRGHDAAALARVKGNATLATLLSGVCLEVPPRAATPPPAVVGPAKAPKHGDDVHPSKGDASDDKVGRVALPEGA